MFVGKSLLWPAACLALLISTSIATAGDGKVSGKVVIDGMPVEGRVFFHLNNGEFVGAKIKDASYTVSRVPEGTWKITVEGKGVPAKYASEKTSALKVNVKTGATVLNIVLVSR